MEQSTAPLLADVVLIGGGHAHVHLVKMAGMDPLSSILSQNGIRITLISNTIYAPYSGMLPGYVSGHYTFEDIHLDLRVLCSFGNVRFVHTEAIGIEHNNESRQGWVLCADGRPNVRYDTLSIDIGSSPSLPLQWKTISHDENGLNDGSSLTPVKPISSFASRWDSICQRLKRGIGCTGKDDNIQNTDTTSNLYNPQRPFVLLVVGGGAGGIELALSAQYALENIIRNSGKDVTKNYARECVKIILATRGNNLLESHNKHVQSIFNRILKERGIRVQCNTEGIDIMSGKNSTDANTLVVSKSSMVQQSIQFDECLWCTSAGAASWLSESTPFKTTREGFLEVRDTYECLNHPGVFAVGDCCHMTENPRPKAGVFAVRAGPIVKENIIAYLLKKPLISHEPQREFLGLISTGDKYAVASRGCFALEGSFLWKLKDQIDRTWMNGYKELPLMTGDTQVANNNVGLPPILQTRGQEAMVAFAESNMRCGGCGAKVGATTLTRVLDAVHRRRYSQDTGRDSSEYISSTNRVDCDDAAIFMLPKKGGAMIHTIDFFRSFISDPFLFGKIAAVHALSDCHAMGAQPMTALALAVVPFAASESMTETTLIDMLSGASDCLAEEKCELSGGHTCEGVELALGFSVNGYIEDPSLLLKKKGGKVGDKIILTKAIGTGALFAADMRAKCSGHHVEEALKSMTTSNRRMSEVAMRFVRERSSDPDKGVHACTDVTGFGLIGHLLEMLLANDSDDTESIDATINLKNIHFFEGAVEAVSNGILSSLQRENLRSRRAISNHEDVARDHPTTYPLLFDPQTAGGLLFFISSEHCDQFMRIISKEDCLNHATVIGELTPSTASCLACGQTTENRIFIEY